MGKTLVAYFSYSGNAKRIAEKVAALAGADIFEIKTETPYSTDYQACIEEARKEVAEGARPKLVRTISDISEYDTVVVGFPNWCSTCPMPVLTFLESLDFSGKKIYSFVTNGGGGCGNSTADIKKSCPSATVEDSINGNDLDDEKIKAWLGL